jgi:aryl-alcohol dehydrogenase-like predicted oxidoreductase
MLDGMPLASNDRLILGCWQLARGHGRDVEDPERVLEAHVAAGFGTLDCADIYTGVEETIGRFAAAHGLGPQQLRVHTKYVPDLAELERLRPDDVRAAIERSCVRLRRDALDLVQFHWWDYGVPGFLEALETLHELQREGRVHAIGLTNVDAAHLRAAVDHGVDVAAVQTQFSLLDRRPRGAFQRLAADAGVAILAYGSLAGGLLSQRHLGADDIAGGPENRSLVKYRLIVEEIGGWSALQALLGDVQSVADELGSDVASVAAAWCLAQGGVRACVVGIRSTRHVERLVALRDAAELPDAAMARLERARGRFPEVPGEVYGLERDRDGPHGRIMRYGLNEEASA